jgi:hypothetical protein
MGGKDTGPSAAEMMQMQRTLQNEAFAMQEAAALRQEERAAQRRAEERQAELDRRRDAELERTKVLEAEELREQQIMVEAEAGRAEDEGTTMSGLNLDVPQIEQPDYAPRTELE